MHRQLRRIGLSVLLTLGVVAWNQAQSSSFAQPSQDQNLLNLTAEQPNPTLIRLIQAAQTSR